MYTWDEWVVGVRATLAALPCDVFTEDTLTLEFAGVPDVFTEAAAGFRTRLVSTIFGVVVTVSTACFGLAATLFVGPSFVPVCFGDALACVVFISCFTEGVGCFGATTIFVGPATAVGWGPAGICARTPDVFLKPEGFGDLRRVRWDGISMYFHDKNDADSEQIDIAATHEVIVYRHDLGGDVRAVEPAV
jgi:hypothetical protein